MSTEYLSCGVSPRTTPPSLFGLFVYLESFSDKETAKTGKQFRLHWGRCLLASDFSGEYDFDVMYLVFLASHGESGGTRHVLSPKDNLTEGLPVF